MPKRYEVSPLDPAAYAAAAVFLAAATLLTAWILARRAARIDPGIAEASRGGWE